MKELPAAGASQAIELPLDGRLNSALRLPIALANAKRPFSRPTAVRLFSAAAPAVCFALACAGRAQ